MQIHSVTRYVHMHQVKHTDSNRVLDSSDLYVTVSHRKSQAGSSAHHLRADYFGLQRGRARIVDQLIHVTLQFPVFEIGWNQNSADGGKDDEHDYARDLPQHPLRHFLPASRDSSSFHMSS